jgi:cytidine deaminase
MDARALIAAAQQLAHPFAPSEEVRSGGVSSALVTAEGNIYTGICIDTACSLGFCAEHAAIAEMLKSREAEIAMIVAIDCDGKILAPCGRCRELIWQVHPRNAETQVILAGDRIVRLADLLPERR